MRATSIGGDSGLVILDKPAGPTSHDMVALVRRMLGTRKVGHAGTLDPMATGVIVLGVNRATRMLGHLLTTDKVYDATIRLGRSTSTDDAEGEVVATAPTDEVTDERVLTALSAFVGQVDQVPSSVSAIKVDGRRAYELVRAGETVELAARSVTIDSIEVHRLQHGEGNVDVDVSVHCSSGTYIRAIARDLGQVLGTGGHLTALRRTAVGAFGLDVARTPEQLAQDQQDQGAAAVVLPIGEAARIAFPSHSLSAEEAADVRFGRKLQVSLPDPGPVAVFAPEGEFLALYEQADELARAVAVFV